MRQRLAEPAEEHRRWGRKRSEPIRDPGEGHVIHLAERLVPPMPDAGATLQIAAIRRLDVDLRQAVKGLPQGRGVRVNLRTPPRTVIGSSYRKTPHFFLHVRSALDSH
jgi:hypothetical protein